MRVRYRPRWITSFIDLVLIMLGALALLIANKMQGPQVVNAVSETFGGSAPTTGSRQFEFDQIFETNEARLTADGRHSLTKVAEAAADNDMAIYIYVPLPDRHSDRLQGWELAAARTASIAYTLTNNGVDRDRIFPQYPGSDSKVGSEKIVIGLRPK